MNWLIALRLIPLITDLIKIAEGILGPGTGIQKKAFVVDGITQVINAMVEFSTGGQKKTWEAINNVIEPIKGLIDVIAGLFFPHKEE